MAITIFIGAGAAIDIGGENTDTITKRIREDYVLNGGNYKLRIFETIADKLDKYFVYKKSNFEEIFYVLELLETYYHAQQKEIKPQFKVPFAPFIDIKQAVDEIFKDLPDDTSITYTPASFFSEAKDKLRLIIAGLVDEYNSKKLPEWYRNFWNVIAASNILNIATLNYDTSIENTGIYFEDGYEETAYDFKEFNPKRLSDTENTILHLHGCINYGYGKYKTNEEKYLKRHREDIVKYSDFKIASSHWDIRIENQALTGEEAIIGPIITGLRKPDKLIAYPYSFYNYWFTKSILENKSLLIIGYSFGDLHFNATLERIMQIHKDYKIVIIDCRNFEKAVSKKDCSNLIINSNPIFTFLEKVFQKYGIAEETINKFDVGNGEPIISDNGRVKMYLEGFEKTIERYGDEIISFLNNDA